MTSRLGRTALLLVLPTAGLAWTAHDYTAGEWTLAALLLSCLLIQDYLVPCWRRWRQRRKDSVCG